MLTHRSLLTGYFDNGLSLFLGSATSATKESIHSFMNQLTGV